MSDVLEVATAGDRVEADGFELRPSMRLRWRDTDSERVLEQAHVELDEAGERVGVRWVAVPVEVDGGVEVGGVMMAPPELREVAKGRKRGGEV